MRDNSLGGLQTGTVAAGLSIPERRNTVASPSTRFINPGLLELILRAYLFLLITTMSWGANAVAGKLAVEHISPMLLTSFRWGMALMVLMTFALPQLRRDAKVIRANLPLLAAYGSFGFACFNILLYSAVQHTTAINVAIEQAGTPMVIFLANFLLFRIRVTVGQFIGFFLTLSGVAITASSGNLERLIGLELNRGDALMLLAVLLYGGYTVALRYKPELHWQSMITVMAASAFVTSLPFTAWEAAQATIIWPDSRGWLVAVYTAVFPSLIAQVLFIKSNEIIGSNRAGLFINLVPIFGTFMSVLILGEVLHIYHVIALTLVLGGIWLAERSKK